MSTFSLGAPILPVRSRWPWWFMAVFFVGFSVFLEITILTAPRLGDYDNRREFGRRLLAGESLYWEGPDGPNKLCFNYMPVSALYWSPLALVRPGLGMAIQYVVSLGCLAFTFHVLGRMVRAQPSRFSWDQPTCVVITILLGMHFLLRDLCDGGFHLIMLAMMVAGIFYAWQGREKLSALWLGLAIALKMTPGLFLPFLLWKRKWRLAAYTALATAAWIASPALWMGPSRWWQEQQAWNQVALNVFSDHYDHDRVSNEIVVNNQTLKLTIVRFLVTYPEGHRLKVDHPADIAFLDLSPATANRLANAAIALMIGALAWWSRRPYRAANDMAWVTEASMVVLLSLILSPVIGLRHGVFALPAIYLIVVYGRGFARLGRAANAVLWLYIAISLLMNRALLDTPLYMVLSSFHLQVNRALLGKPLYMVLLSFHLHMVCMLMLLWLLTRVRPTAWAEA